VTFVAALAAAELAWARRWRVEVWIEVVENDLRVRRKLLGAVRVNRVEIYVILLHPRHELGIRLLEGSGVEVSRRVVLPWAELLWTQELPHVRFRCLDGGIFDFQILPDLLNESPNLASILEISVVNFDAINQGDLRLIRVWRVLLVELSILP